MATVDLFRALVMGLLAVAVLLRVASIPLLCTIFFLLGTAETLFDTAGISILPTLVPKTGLTRANGRLLSAQIVTDGLAAPPLGGLLFAAATAVPFRWTPGRLLPRQLHPRPRITCNRRMDPGTERLRGEHVQSRVGARTERTRRGDAGRRGGRRRALGLKWTGSAPQVLEHFLTSSRPHWPVPGGGSDASECP
jgi:hypothetical protein